MWEEPTALFCDVNKQKAVLVGMLSGFVSIIERPL